MEIPSQTESQLSAGLDERELQIREDYDWALEDPDIQKRYAGLVVAVYKKTVLASGTTHGEATELALKQANCPPRHHFARVYIEGHRTPQASEG